MKDGDANYSCPTGRRRAKLSEGRKNMWLKFGIRPIHYSGLIICIQRTSWESLGENGRDVLGMFSVNSEPWACSQNTKRLLYIVIWQSWYSVLVFLAAQCTTYNVQHKDSFQCITNDGRVLKSFVIQDAEMICWLLHWPPTSNVSSSNINHLLRQLLEFLKRFN